MNKLNPDQKRRYYLHRRLKLFCKVNAQGRYISIPEEDANALKGIRLKYVYEMVTKHKYVIQYTANLNTM